MKYIRTKDKIYELKENDATQTPEEVQIALITGNYKQSDTIEELCDRFVYNRIGEYEVYRNIETDFKENDINYIKRGGSITGAIWTSKGLIYVAKMDSEGNLVLI